jgi:septal ring factor EnvC (AmiA/AmiB activator)
MVTDWNELVKLEKIQTQEQKVAKLEAQLADAKKDLEHFKLELKEYQTKKEQNNDNDKQEGSV